MYLWKLSSGAPQLLAIKERINKLGSKAREEFYSYFDFYTISTFHEKHLSEAILG